MYCYDSLASFQWKHEFTMVVAVPSKSGKTEFVKRLVENRHWISPPPRKSSGVIENGNPLTIHKERMFTLFVTFPRTTKHKNQPTRPQKTPSKNIPPQKRPKLIVKLPFQKKKPHWKVLISNIPPGKGLKSRLRPGKVLISSIPHRNRRQKLKSASPCLSLRNRPYPDQDTGHVEARIGRSENGDSHGRAHRSIQYGLYIWLWAFFLCV